MTAFAKLAAVETKLLVREPGSLVSVLIPLFFLVVFGASADATDTVLLPMGMAIAVALIGLYLLPTTLASYRERGILRRMSTTPVRPGNLLTVQMILQLVLLAAATALQLAVAGGVLGLSLPAGFAPVALVFALGTAAMFAIGLLIAALAPTGRAANGIGVLLYFPMAYLAGLIQPARQMPASLARIGEYTPLGAFRTALGQAWTGQAPEPLPLVLLAAYTVLISAVAARAFRWE
ncbi:ABC-2 type transport system permease protein [Glycomyces sambucus]|uniref:ABC-2 type transport system permease protein n=1 Tax=Glycomyces sambucus TaxID=380244 RepID=A0A1G9CU68_9ACTN|nr:ABC transporter permease [Glycomyces sambucus]SDK55213.1 ABC-2 type transport system permease protein [Glycomyces sambucus]